MKLPSPTTALACLTLAACSTTQPAATVPIPANLTQPCPKLSPLAEGADFGDLLEKAVENGGQVPRGLRPARRALGAGDAINSPYMRYPKARPRLAIQPQVEREGTPSPPPASAPTLSRLCRNGGEQKRTRRSPAHPPGVRACRIVRGEAPQRHVPPNPPDGRRDGDEQAKSSDLETEQLL